MSVKFLTTAAAVLGMTLAAQAQTFTYTTAYDTTYNYGDTMFFDIPNPIIGAYGTATITVEFNGDFGDGGEQIDMFDESWTLLGASGQSPLGDCNPGSTDITFSAPIIDTWSADNVIHLYGIPSGQVDFFCNGSLNEARITITYEYCAFGTPVEFAAITSPLNDVCTYETISLAGTPSGGTFSGMGVSGNTFNPANLSAGMYQITYTATDAIGCVTSTTEMVKVNASPMIADVHICPNTSIIIGAPGTQTVWSASSNFSNPLDTTGSFNTGTLAAPTTFYAANSITGYYFMIDSLTVSNSAIVDHDALTSDDRSGIAVTPNYVYIVGDGNTARFDLDLTNGISLPIRDGIFSNLTDGTLYTLYDGANDMTTFPGTFTLTGLRSLNTDLTQGSQTINLSQTIDIGDNNDQTGIFAGFDVLILFNGNNGNWYKIELASGDVTELGNTAYPNAYYGSENWAFWGNAEFDGTDYYAVYRSTNGSGSEITRLNLTTGVATVVADFPADLSDMACFTFSPFNNRWYFHHEGGSGTFGGNFETLGYADAGGTYNALNGVLGCYTQVDVDMDVIDLGADVTICSNENYVIMAPTGYIGYNWNGFPVNVNAFPTNMMGAGTYTLVATAVDGCTITDQIEVTYYAPTTVTLDLSTDFFCTDGTATALDGGLPTGGTYTGNGVSANSFDPAVAGAGGHILTYTFTDANGCVFSADDAAYVGDCSGITDIETFNAVTLFPNPNNGRFAVTVSLVNASSIDVSVLDLTGRVLYQYNSAQTGVEFAHNIELDNIPAGVYFVRIATENGTHTEKMVINN